MNIEFNKLMYNLLSVNQLTIDENIKMLLYKADNNIFDKLDFEAIKPFREPILFSHFNYIKNSKIEHLVAGYYNNPSILQITIEPSETIYLPNICWIKPKNPNENLNITIANGQVEEHPDLKLIPLSYICDGEIEVYPLHLDIFKNLYYDEYENLVDVEVEEVTLENIDYLKKAYNLIKEFAPFQYKLIKEFSPKCGIFKGPNGKRNSFASFAAHGSAFYNAYQPEYNEVFFVDDIAHQTGHVLMNTITRNIEDFIKVDRNKTIDFIKIDGKVVEERSIETMFHALYTYYTTFVCLDACLSNNVFEGNKRLEALGRIKFYLNKCYHDLKLFSDFGISYDIEESKFFTKHGQSFMNEYKRKWLEVENRYMKEVENLSLRDQPYNFTSKIFFEYNPNQINVPI